MHQDVRLRATTVEDNEILFRNQLEPDATAMAGFPPRDRDAFMAHRTKIMADETSEIRTILAGGEVAGDIACWIQDGVREVGYWLGKQFWGRGIATVALRAFVTEVTARPLYAHVVRHNTGSVRVLEKCGFRHLADDERPSDADPEEHLLVLRD